jgi:hypothetical protein
MRHRWQVMWASFDEEDHWLVTAGADAVCIVWDVKTGEPLTAPLEFKESIYFAIFEPGSTHILVRDKKTDSFRLRLPIADLPLTQYVSQSQYAENLPILLEPVLERR